MALLGNPFVANVPRMSNEELLQALRVDIRTNDQRVKKVLQHIADEERRHVGELQQLLFMLSPNEQQQVEQGKQGKQSIQQQAQNFSAAMQ